MRMKGSGEVCNKAMDGLREQFQACRDEVKINSPRG